ncbi:plasma membrane ascorbate-dependent reductase CYBRD1 isoform X1 [Equus caballus]|uniref:plasma membrane ascorbate-dependent reductase CYBRD1 isoform X1 n=1 Tax=Equus caballus TaxID=9796 RepID=UPI0038B39CA0
MSGRPARKPLLPGGDCFKKSTPASGRGAGTQRPPPPPSVPVACPGAEYGTLMAMDGYRGFLGLLVSALLVGFLSVIFTLVWVLHYREGLGWDGTALEFNWHPVLVVTGFVFIQGIAIIVYRLPWTWKCSKFLMKSIHAGLNTVAAVLAIISLVAVFDFHNARNIPNMYSLHSWIGLIAVILYMLQLLLGFFIFLLPWAPLSLRALVMPIHVYSGLLIFGTVIATALTGVTEKLIFALKDPAYHSFPPEGVFTNTLGLLILLFGSLIFWIVTRPQWKRPNEPNSILLQPKGGTTEGLEGSMAINVGNVDKSDSELNNEGSARKRNFTLDEAGQRSTM